jgi:transcriptional regulator with XRE-family HTH domain
MDMIGKIRRLHSRKNKSVREISRITGLSRNTISKWLHGDVDGEPKYRRAEQDSQLTPFGDELRQTLTADARQPRHERRTAMALFAQIKLSGYAGGYSRVTDFVRQWRQQEGQAAVANAFVPLAFELGEAYQFDWSEEGMLVGGIYCRVQLCEFAQAAARTRCALKAKFDALAIRKGRRKSVIALAHKMLRTVYAMLANGTHYQDKEIDYEALNVQRNAPRWMKMLRKHGFIATPSAA